jgi:hypothetical protein
VHLFAIKFSNAYPRISAFNNPDQINEISIY